MGAVVAPVQKKPPVAPGLRPRKVNPPGQLPTWDELTLSRPQNTIQVVEKTASGAIGTYKTLKFALSILLVVIAGTLYVGHVYATQDALEEVRELRRLNTVLHLEHNRVRGELDEKTAPGEILERARELGLTEDYAYEPPIWKD